MEQNRKKEVINVCLDHFIEKDLSEVSTRSLSRALQLQNAGQYYYFESKDATVIQCAEEAALRLENTLIPPILNELHDPDTMTANLQQRADEMSSTMRFFISVCVSERYKDSVKPVLDRLLIRYRQYLKRIADTLMCDEKNIEPYVYTMITSMVNYMVFREVDLIRSQVELTKCVLNQLNRLGNPQGTPIV